MASGKVGDGYIEIHADDSPFRAEMARLMSKVGKDLDKQAEDIGKSMGDAMGKSMRDAIDPHLKRMSKDIGNDLDRNLNRQAAQTGKKAGKALADNFSKEAKKASGDVDINVDADTKAAEKKIRSVTEDQKATVDVDADTGKAAASLAWVARNRVVNLWVQARTKAVTAQIGAIAKGLSGIGALGAWNKSLTSMLETLPQTILKMGTLFGSMASLAAPALNLVAAIGPLAAGLLTVAQGAVAVGPAMLGLATIFGVAKAAFSDLSKAQGEAGRFHTNTERWSQSWKNVAKDIQKAWFESKRFNNAFADMADKVFFTKTFREGLNGVSRALSDVASGAMEGFTKQFDTAAAGTFFANLTKGIKAAAPGFEALGRAIAIIAEKGAPLFEGMGDAIGRWGKQLEQWAKKTDIVKMAQDAYNTWLIFWQMLKGIGNTLKNVFKAMTPPGSTTSALQGMANLWTRIAEITASPVFKQSMAVIFAGAARGAAALSGAMAPLGQSLASMAPTLRDILGLLGELGASVVTGLSKVLGNLDFQGALEGAVTAIKDMVAGIDFDTVAQALTTLLQVVAAVAPIIDDLLNAFLSVASGLLSSVLPALQAFSSFLDGNKAAAEALVKIIVLAAAAITGFGLAMKGVKLAQTLGGFESAGAMFEAFSSKMPKTSKGLTKVAKGAGAAAAAIGALSFIGGALQATTDAGKDSIEEYGIALKQAAKGGSTGLDGLNASFSKLQTQFLGIQTGTPAVRDAGDALKQISDRDTSGFMRFEDGLSRVTMGMFGLKTTSDQAREEIAKMDQGLAGMDAASASAAFNQISQSVVASGGSIQTAATQLPQYQTALAGVASQVGVFNLSAEEYAQWMGGAVPAAVQTAVAANPSLITALTEQEAAFAGVDPAAYATAMGTAVQPPKNVAEAVQQATDAMFGFASAQLQLSGTQIGMEESFDAAASSAKKYGETLDVNTAAGRANQTALDNQATSSQAYVQSLLEQHAPLEQVEGAMTRARTQYIKNATAMGASATEANNMADAMGLIPEDVSSKVDAEVYGQAAVEAINTEIGRLESKKVKAEAEGDDKEVKRLNEEIRKLQDKTVDITTNMHQNTYINKVYTTKSGSKYEAAGGILDFYAQGGLVQKFAAGAENHVAQIARAGTMRVWAEPETGGEAYIPLAASKRRRSLKIWEATGRRLGAYARGGTAGMSAMGGSTVDGLVKGISGNAGPLSEALVGVMKKAVGDLANYLGIHSPSRLLKGYGLNTGKGLAEGVKEGAKKHGPGVSAALKRFVKKYVINAADFKSVTKIYEGYGADMTTALAYGIRNNGELLDETTKWLADRSSDIIKKEIDRITALAKAANAKLTAKKKSTKSKAGDKALDAQIKANNAALAKQVKALEQYEKKVASMFEKQNALSNFNIWWKYGDEKGARKIADSLTSTGKWVAGASADIRKATLADIAKAQEGLQDLLDDATAMRDSVRDNLVGGFELKGLTSMDQLKGTLGKWVGQAKTFATKLRELAKKGYPKSFIQQVAGLGFVDGVAVANVLLTASDEDVAAITADYAELVAQATEIGTIVAETMFSSGQKIQEGLIAGLTADIAKLEKAASSIAKALVDAIKKELKIKSPSAVMAGLGGQAATGFANGIAGGQAAVAKSMSALTGAATPSGRFDMRGLDGARATQPGSAGATNWNLNINGNLIGSNPRIEQAVRLLMEVIGDGRRYERAGWVSTTPALGGVR